MTKKIFKIVLILTITFIAGFVLSVRYGSLNISNRGKTIFGFDKVQNKFIINNYKKYLLESEDGPYIFDNGNTFEIVNVVREKEEYLIKSFSKEKDSLNIIPITVNNNNKDKFEVKLSKKEVFNNTSPIIHTNSKIIAISDIEGNFNGFSSFLKKQNVIDSNFNWIFGNGHLVLVGDFMDRGDNVIESLWLIFKLEKQAEQYGGQVHYILGNHEAMNFYGHLGYLSDKYKAFAQEYSKNLNFEKEHLNIMNNSKFILGNWLKSKNVIESINNILFVHGGISPELLEAEFTIEEINSLTRDNISKNLYGLSEKDNQKDKKANLLMGRKGPMWYRGLLIDYKKHYKKMDDSTYSKIFSQFNVNKIVIGHTLVHDIHLHRNNSLINIDVKHGQEKNSGKTKGILIEEGNIFVIDDNGYKEKIRTL
jgi:Calcineurin-like phosphoesterase.